MHVADDTKPCRVILPDEMATLALGAKLATCLNAGMTVYLDGDLGAGKTTLTRGVLRALGHTGRVRSPTYTLTEIYSLPAFELYHFDLYRMHDPREWLDAGFRDVADSGNVSLVEWPARAQGLLPPPDLRIGLAVQDDGRVADIVALTPRGKECLRTCCG
jgi:tRNA threonylcarbamoyladenosine biosynthesis protein TsaE